MKDRGKHMIGPPLTLGETIMQFVREGKTKTPEFEALVKFFGKEYLRKLYEDERAKECGTKLESTNSEPTQPLSAPSVTPIDPN